MKKFSKYTICSDLDGTLWDYNGIVPENNLNAIEYFTKNGGKFILTTGRSPDFIKELEKKGLSSRPYAIALNGAMIYDMENDKIVYENEMKKSMLEGFDEFIKENEHLILSIHYHTDGEVKEYSQLEGRKLYKIVFVSETVEDTTELKNNLKNCYGRDFFITNSWPTGLEILDINSTKGEAIMVLKQYLGDNAENVVCVGDYENDIPMLKVADISYAVENASDETKEVSQRITVSNLDGAIAQIVSDLESENVK